MWGVVALAGVAWLAGVPAARAATLAGQGWKVTGEGVARVVQMQATVANEEAAAASYQVRFSLDAMDKQLLNETKKPSEAAGPWTRVWSEVTDPVSIPGHSSAVFSKSMAYDKMGDGSKAYRFQAELVNSSQQVVAVTPLTSQGVPFGDQVAAGMTGAATLVAVAGGAGVLAVLQRGHGGIVDVHTGMIGQGTGTMTGTHTAHYSDGKWVEHGSGTITLHDADGGIMTLNYTYDSTGANAGVLVASATASGTLTTPQGSSPVSVTTSRMQMTKAGARQKTGHVVTRTGCEASGTFSGTVGGRPASGTITLTAGTQTLDTTTGQGTHTFQVTFSAGQ